MNDFGNIPVAVQPSASFATASTASEKSTSGNYDTNSRAETASDFSEHKESTVSNSDSNGGAAIASGFSVPEKTTVGNSNPQSNTSNISSGSTEPKEQTRATTPSQSSSVTQQTDPTEENTPPKPAETTKPQDLPPQTTTDNKTPTNNEPSEVEPTKDSDNEPMVPQPTISDGDEDIEGFVVCSEVFSPDLLTGSGKVYCRLYNSYCMMIGDSNWFSGQHIADVNVISSNTVMATYTPAQVGLSLSRGKYYYNFYNENGEDICQGSVYLS
ncbi:MAG: hypothetical protein ACI4RF_04865 [Eubacterium sp.]